MILLVCQFGYSQFNDDEGGTQKLKIPTDSTSAATSRGTLETFKTIFEGKPGKSALYGVLIPGGGQLYNKRYWKAPIVWAIDGVAIWWYIDNRMEYIGWRDAYIHMLKGEITVYNNITNRNTIRTFRNDARLQTERAGFTIILVHLLSVIEAFTDQHLMDFDIDDDLSFTIKNMPIDIPFSSTSVTGVGLKYRF